MTAIVLRGDARQLPLPDECVDLIVTSPPYFGLRSSTLVEGGRMDAELTVQDALIRRWQDEAAQLDAQATRARAADQGGQFQIHGWETRAQALRDCATELWQLATGTDEEGACLACGTPLQLCGHRPGTDAKSLREAADRIAVQAPAWSARMREEARRLEDTPGNSRR